MLQFIPPIRLEVSEIELIAVVRYFRAIRRISSRVLADGLDVKNA
jgi:hypothetical protein